MRLCCLYCFGLTGQPSVDGTFEANLINSVVFLMTCVQQVCSLAII